MIPKFPSSRCLWKTQDEQEFSSPQQQLQQKKETYDSILKDFLADPPPPKSLSSLCCNSLVVGQEFALTCLFWARHRVVAIEEEGAMYYATKTKQHQLIVQQQQQMIRSQFMALMALIVIAIYTNSSQSLPQPQPRKAKVKQRTSDAILLAILLRLSASVLRTLTASFSTDTVEHLTVAGMVIHWLTCDYAYANATNNHNSMATAIAIAPPSTRAPPTTATNVSIEEETSRAKDSGTFASPAMPNPTHARTTLLSTVPNHHNNKNNNKVKSTARVTASSKRPTFQGGTVSLNAAFFSTTLLASRLSSNAAVYIFVSSAIILFAFYPAARHAISHHPHRAWIHSFVTLMLSWSTFFLLQDAKECLYFTALLVTICGIAPLWKFWLQRFKRKISGPWDVVSVSEMMLDY